MQKKYKNKEGKIRCWVFLSLGREGKSNKSLYNKEEVKEKTYRHVEEKKREDYQWRREEEKDHDLGGEENKLRFVYLFLF